MGAYLKEISDKIKQIITLSYSKRAGSPEVKAAVQLINEELTLHALQIFSDLVLQSENNLKLKYSQMQQQIETIYSKHLTAKFVGLSGAKNLVFGVWMIVIQINSPIEEVEISLDIIKSARELIKNIWAAKKHRDTSYDENKTKLFVL